MECAAFARFDTQLTADSVEALPDDRSTFVCGTYQLEGDGTRIGRLHLLSLRDSNLQLLHQLDVQGIFDLKWVQLNAQWHLSQAAADAALYIWALDRNAATLAAADSSVHRTPLSDVEGAMALSLDWHDGGDPQVAVTLSTGHLVVLQGAEGGFAVHTEWQAHGLQGFGGEMWCGVWDPHSPHVLYSGADDCLLKTWDVRDTTRAAQTKRHMMGVTCVAPHPTHPHLLAYGSYDEHVRLVDRRQLRSELADLHIEGGGIWRLKWHPEVRARMCVAAMHAGAAVVECDRAVVSTDDGPTPSEAEAEAPLTVCGRHVEHGSMTYGIDWVRDPAVGGDVLGTCSFYDRTLHLWRVSSNGVRS